jgi:very-short-patch-repair endonuclease
MKKMRVAIVCIGCGNVFTLPASQALPSRKCCSVECKCVVADRAKTSTCLTCERTFVRFKSSVGKYCSIACRSASADWRDAQGDAHRGMRHSAAVREKIRIGRGHGPTAVGWHHTDETKRRIGEASRVNVAARWAVPGYRDRWARSVLPARAMRPNKFETRLLAELDRIVPGEFRYVGDGSLIVGGKCPDFVHRDLPLLVEGFGDYWHRGENPQERIDYFTRFGYHTLVIWEHELVNPNRKIDAAVALSMASAKCLYLTL